MGTMSPTEPVHTFPGADEAGAGGAAPVSRTSKLRRHLGQRMRMPSRDDSTWNVISQRGQIVSMSMRWPSGVCAG
jgi:hypothetical protein